MPYEEMIWVQTISSNIKHFANDSELVCFQPFYINIFLS